MACLSQIAGASTRVNLSRHNHNFQNAGELNSLSSSDTIGGYQFPWKAQCSNPSSYYAPQERSVKTSELSCLPLTSKSSHYRRLHVVAAARGFGSSAQKEKDNKGEKGSGIKKAVVCPCGGGEVKRGYKDCCKLYHGGVNEPDAESLMRARYSAFAKGLSKYIVRTTHMDCPDYKAGAEALLRDVEQTCARCEFRGLEVRKVEAGSSPDEAFVTFKVTYGYKGIVNEGNSYLHERSRFVREDNRWLYREQLVVDPASSTEWGLAAGYNPTAVKGARTYSTSKTKPNFRFSKLFG